MLKRNLNSGSQPSSKQSHQQLLSLQSKDISDRQLPQRFRYFNPSIVLTLKLNNNRLEGQISTWTLLGQFSSLKVLSISHNNLKHCYLNYLSASLQSLNLSHNRISQLNFQHHLNRLRELNIEHNLLLRLQITYQNTSLTRLKIGNNRLSVLGLGQLMGLSELDADKNEIIVINLPPSVKYINLSHNLLKTVAFISKLTNLEHLDISHNQIKELQLRSIQHKPNFKYLDASYNRIKFLDGFETLRNLQTLNLSHNYLPLRMMDEILKLQHLKQFECLGNQFNNESAGIQAKEKLLKTQLPIRTLKIFELQSPLNTTSRAQTSQRKRAEKKYAYFETSELESQRRRSERNTNRFEATVKDSPFKLYVQSSRSKPTVYTLGNNDSHSLEKLNSKEPETKYFLQILNKYYMIPMKPIMKKDAEKMHRHQVSSGMQYSLLRDLYRSQGLKFNRIFKTTNLKQLEQINRSQKQNKGAATSHSLYFLNALIDPSHLEGYFSNSTSFKQVIALHLESLRLSIFPSEGAPNYIIKTSFAPSHFTSKQQFQFDGSQHHFSLIFLIE